MSQRKAINFLSLVLVTSVLLVNTSCSKPMTALSAVSYDDSEYLLRYKMSEGQSWNYTRNEVNKARFALTQIGYDLDQELSANILFSVNCIKRDDQKNLNTEVLLGDIDYNEKTSLAGKEYENHYDFSDAKGKAFNLTMSELGYELDFSGIEKFNYTIETFNGIENNIPFKEFFRNVFINLPEKPVKIGDTWVVEGTGKSPGLGGFENNAKYSASVKLEGLEKRNRRDCLRFKMITKGTNTSSREADPEEPWRVPYMEGQGEFNVTQFAYFDYRNGVLAELVSEAVSSGMLTTFYPDGIYDGPYTATKTIVMKLVQ